MSFTNVQLKVCMKLLFTPAGAVARRSYTAETETAEVPAAAAASGTARQTRSPSIKHDAPRLPTIAPALGALRPHRLARVRVRRRPTVPLDHSP